MPAPSPYVETLAGDESRYIFKALSFLLFFAAAAFASTEPVPLSFEAPFWSALPFCAALSASRCIVSSCWMAATSSGVASLAATLLSLQKYTCPLREFSKEVLIDSDFQSMSVLMHVLDIFIFGNGSMFCQEGKGVIR